MSDPPDFHAELEQAVRAQLRSQRVGYLLGAGSSYLGGGGYPLTFELWDRVKDSVDQEAREAIQAKLNEGALGIENALDQLDDGGALDTPHRHAVTKAIAELFRPLAPCLVTHSQFVSRIAARADRRVLVFSLNYDPLIERAADHARVRLTDGFRGIEAAYFDAAELDERPYYARASHKGPRLTPAARPIHLLKLHGSLGWYEQERGKPIRSSFGQPPTDGARLLMIPPQRRKATDTMLPPYAALWSRFRGCLTQDAEALNRLACFGYGFADHHVNEVIEPALARSDFTLLIFTKALTDEAWERWSPRKSSIVVTEDRCSLYGTTGPGHADLWDFQRIAKEV